MKVSKNAYYHWSKVKTQVKTKPSKLLLKERILVLFNENRQVYGSYRIQKLLAREGLIYSRSYIAVLMREMGLKSVLRRKYVITTDSNHSYNIANNELGRNFKTIELGKKWVSDITYIRVGDQWNYLTTIIDLADRKVVGWSLSKDMTAENTVMKAWQLARKTRKIANGFIFHSDRGVQYASIKLTKLMLYNIKITQSMSRKGNCWDNAVAESFFKTIKHECLLRYKFKNYEELYDCVSNYIFWYNTKRLHSSLGYLTPLEKEMQLRKIINKAA
jgi:transposase InsO family protein